MPMSTISHWQTENPDALTGLPDGRDFLRRLDESLRLSAGHAAGVAVAILLLDGLEAHGRLHGQTAVEFTVRDIAGRISQMEAPLSLAARLSAYEFGLLITPYRDKSSLKSAIDQITREIHRPVLLDQREILPTGSLGVAIATPFNLGADLVDQARVAAGAAQQAGGDQVRWID